MSDNEPDDERDRGQTGATLRVLSRRAPVTSGWRAPDTVRRSAMRRRRAKWSGGVAVVLAAAVGIALSLGGGASHRPLPAVAAPHHVAGGPVHEGARIGPAVQLVANAHAVPAASASITDAVVAAEQRLGIALLRKAGSDSNVTVSPASLYFALGMLQNAARGRTADEIGAALQADGMSTDDQNAGLSSLTDELDAAARKDGLQLDSANSIWQQRGFAVRPQFLAALDAYYRTGLWQVDFDGDTAGAINAIDDWTSQHTHGKITRLFDELDRATVLVLANAMYFHADWATPFKPTDSEDGPFTRSDGKKVTAKFMSGGGDQNVLGVATRDYQAVQLRYAGGRFAALAVMPTSGSLDSFVGKLTPDKIDSIASSVKLAKVSLPRFTTRSTLDLKPVLQALGMHAAFTEGAADLSGMSDAHTVVDQVVQRTYLSVGEKGTTAAAATGVSMSDYAASARARVLLNHPFVFLVRDTKTGAILFASEITDPTAG